jgi:hypothetical protein
MREDTNEGIQSVAGNTTVHRKMLEVDPVQLLAKNVLEVKFSKEVKPG